MKWGVRRYQPYPKEYSGKGKFVGRLSNPNNKRKESSYVLKAGTRINSVSGKYANSDDYKNSGRWMYTYRDDNEWDNKVYKGPFSKYLVLQRGARFIKEHLYETTKDLKMPSKTERVEEFKKLTKSQKTIKELEDFRKTLIYYNVGNEKEREDYKNIKLNNLKTEEDYTVAYSVFSHMMEASWVYGSTRKDVEKIRCNGGR